MRWLAAAWGLVTIVSTAIILLALRDVVREMRTERGMSR